MSVEIPVKKILVLSANPKGTKQLRLNEEIREIKDGLRLAKQRDSFQIESAEAVRDIDIHRSILNYEPQIIHFSGHGAGEEGLIFEDNTGQQKLVDAAALAGLFELFADQVECVLLNACYSEIQAKAIAQHINYVIGMSQEIGDKAAIKFAVGFYDALGAGRSVEFAYKLGCQVIRMAGIREHLTPKLLRKEDLQGESINTTHEQAGAVQEEVLEPYKIYKQQFTKKVAEQAYPLGEKAEAELNKLQNYYDIKDEFVNLLKQEGEQQEAEKLRQQREQQETQRQQEAEKLRQQQEQAQKRRQQEQVEAQRLQRQREQQEAERLQRQKQLEFVVELIGAVVSWSWETRWAGIPPVLWFMMLLFWGLLFLFINWSECAALGRPLLCNEL
jgi:hypothetical protein